jgi:hypothetical protein
MSLSDLGQKLTQVCAAGNIYVTGAEKGNRTNPLSDTDEIRILTLIEILSGRLPEDTPWPAQ